MRVGVVTTSYPRAAGDPSGSFVAAHVDWLVRAGHMVDVLCASAPGGHIGWQAGVRVLPVTAPAGLFYEGGAPEALAARGVRALGPVARFSAGLVAAAARHGRRWDVAFAHWLVPGAAALVPAARPGRPVVAIAHSGDVHLVRRLGLATPLAAGLWARRARVAFVSEYVRRRFLAGVGPVGLRQALHARSLVTPMGIDLARWRSTRPERAQAGERVVLFLGRLVPIKGARVLIDAAARLPRACGPVRVVVAGDGPERASLADRIQGLAAGDHCRIEMVGEVRGPARDRLLASADVLVLPSRPVAGGRSEGAPVTALEAMAAGVPVIASRTGGLAELPASVATLVPAGDPEALADALARCLQDELTRARQVRAAAQWVEQHDWDKVGARLWALVEQGP